MVRTCLRQAIRSRLSATGLRLTPRATRSGWAATSMSQPTARMTRPKDNSLAIASWRSLSPHRCKWTAPDRFSEYVCETQRPTRCLACFCLCACTFCRVGEFGIDSNVFSSDYKAPTNNDHITVAMVHIDDDKPDKKSAQKAQPKSAKKAQMTLLSGNSRFQ